MDGFYLRCKFISPADLINVLLLITARSKMHIKNLLSKSTNRLKIYMYVDGLEFASIGCPIVIDYFNYSGTVRCLLYLCFHPSEYNGIKTHGLLKCLEI